MYIILQTHVFCLVREVPGQTGLDRVRRSLEQYGILVADSMVGTEQQQKLHRDFSSRVSAVKGPLCAYTCIVDM